MSTTNNSALASLTETYTDSENEEPYGEKEKPNITKKESDFSFEPNQQRPQKSLRLVSYDNNEQISDDEQHPEDKKNTSETEVIEIDDKFAKYQKQYGFLLPAEPSSGKCNQQLQDKISTMLEKIKKTDMDMNLIIQNRKEFQNPSIYEKLIQFCNLNELGSNFPDTIYDVSSYGKESYYEELAKTQKIEMDKLEKQKNLEVNKNDRIVQAAKREIEATKRKSKWDQPAAGAVTTNSTTTGTKTTTTTIINAFGSLSKKPKV